jgi:hypothetical protein
LINQVFESRTLVGDDIYFVDNITAARHQPVELEKVSPTLSNHISNIHEPFTSVSLKNVSSDAEWMSGRKVMVS